jgi:hypothetical protein
MTKKRSDKAFADYLDKMIAERTAKNPNFPKLLKEAEERRKRKTAPKPNFGLCDNFPCRRKAIFRVMVSRSAHESARYASACRKCRPEMEL